MRGWFHFPREGQPAQVQGFEAKRLKGFEPSTFCMAIRPISDPARQRIPLFAGVS
jgi:hypothetical protein